MNVEARRSTPTWVPLLIVGAVLLAFFGAALAIALAINSGPSWEVSATNQPDGVLVEAFIGDAVEPNFSVLLEGRSIPRDAVRATPEEFDPEVFESLHRDPTISPGYWAFEIDGVPVGVVSSWMRVGNLQGDDMVIERGEHARYPMKKDASNEHSAPETSR